MGGGGRGETPPFFLLLGLPTSASSERSNASAGAARFFPRDIPGPSIVRAVSESQVTRLYPGMTIEKREKEGKQGWIIQAEISCIIYNTYCIVLCINTSVLFGRCPT